MPKQVALVAGAVGILNSHQSQSGQEEPLTLVR